MVVYNIYCDESGHLPNDQLDVMVQGAVKCPVEKSAEISKRIREIKQKHGVAPSHEIKWTNVAPSKLQMYLELVDFFFDDDNQSFRAVVAPKNNLCHEAFNQTHDNWYYKMLYQLMVNLIAPENHYRIYLDKKDTRGGVKARKLREVLSNSQLDFDQRIIQNLQIVDSSDVRQMQIADLLLGAVGYVNRGGGTSAAKWAVVERIRERSGLSLDKTTLLHATKFNIFIWQGR